VFSKNLDALGLFAEAELRSAWTAEGGRPYANLDGAEPRHHTSEAASYEAPFTNASVVVGMETVTSPVITRRAWKFLSLDRSGEVTS